MGRKKKLIERLSTFNLDGVHGLKPCINDIICDIAERIYLDESRSSRSRSGSIYRGIGDFWDDFSVFGKRGKKGKKNRKRFSQLELFPMEEDDYLVNGWGDDLPFDDVEDGVIGGYKSIIFYPDITNELSYKEFHSVKEFNDFCDKENIYVPRFDASNIGYWSEIHCCLDLGDLEYGEKTLVTDRNYDVLYWSVISSAPDKDFSKAISGKEGGESNDIY